MSSAYHSGWATEAAMPVWYSRPVMYSTGVFTRPWRAVADWNSERFSSASPTA